MDDKPTLKKVVFERPTEEYFKKAPKYSGALVRDSERGMARSSYLGFGIQVLQPGRGETNRHAHQGEDAFWFVLEGTAVFYKVLEDGSEETIRLDKYEGLFIPDSAPYWFECPKDSQEDLVIIRSSAATGAEKKRLNYEQLKDWQTNRGLGGVMVSS